jgi:4-oxalocrotonate tautomerase
MPIITLRMNELPSESITKTIVEKLTDITVKVLKKNKSLVVVRIEHDTDFTRWNVNGEEINNNSSLFELIILVTSGTNSKEEKSEWLTTAWHVMKEGLGNLSYPNYISIKEIDAENWGYNGLSQEERLNRT